MQLTVRVVGLDSLRKKLQPNYLYEPEIESALDTVAKRGQRGGRGRGARMNPIAARARPLLRELTSPLRDPDNRIEAFASFGRAPNRRPNPQFNPRATGVSWLRKNLGAIWATGAARGILGATAGNALRKAAKAIQARWAK